ncbi:MAG: PEP-utilizing enzyme [Rhizobiaceae bacterium]
MSRHIVLEFGSRLHAEHILDDSEDVFMLTLADLWAYSTGIWDGKGARQLVADRRQQIENWATSDPPPDVILNSAGHFETITLPTKHEGSTLVGIGVSPGQAKGRARKVHNPTKPEALCDGGILVARCTDPSWTPLFLTAQGIVVETGGYLSHGAIVAREFGLPAVVNASGCFDAIPDSCDLYIDGDQGRITML